MTTTNESAQRRLNTRSVAPDDADQDPIVGRGLGFEYDYFASGPNQVVVTDLTENITLDRWLRTGLIGLGLFLLALLTALANGLAIVLGLMPGMFRSAVTSGGGGPTALRSYQAMRLYEVI